MSTHTIEETTPAPPSYPIHLQQISHSQKDVSTCVLRCREGDDKNVRGTPFEVNNCSPCCSQMPRFSPLPKKPSIQISLADSMLEWECKLHRIHCAWDCSKNITILRSQNRQKMLALPVNTGEKHLSAPIIGGEPCDGLSADAKTCATTSSSPSLPSHPALLKTTLPHTQSWFHADDMLPTFCLDHCASVGNFLIIIAPSWCRTHQLSVIAYVIHVPGRVVRLSSSHENCTSPTCSVIWRDSQHANSSNLELHG